MLEHFEICARFKAGTQCVMQVCNCLFFQPHKTESPQKGRQCSTNNHVILILISVHIETFISPHWLNK